ncbi:hypothetical protein RUM44_003491 [Polyplax serrata]|uniref:Uncharacterized protein n=1 Tax=Polyplax serrata TaxID=468196 RepID=A0ABR1AGM6_POLSC
MASDEVGVGDLKVRPTRSNSFPSVVVYLSSEEDRFVRRDKDVRVKQEQVGRCLVRFGVVKVMQRLRMVEENSDLPPLSISSSSLIYGSLSVKCLTS